MADITNQLQRDVVSGSFPRLLWEATTNRLGTHDGTSLPCLPRVLCPGVMARPVQCLHVREQAYPLEGAVWARGGRPSVPRAAPVVLPHRSWFSVQRNGWLGMGKLSLGHSSHAEKSREIMRAIHWGWGGNGEGQADPKNLCTCFRFRVCGSDSYRVLISGPWSLL